MCVCAEVLQALRVKHGGHVDPELRLARLQIAALVRGGRAAEG